MRKKGIFVLAALAAVLALPLPASAAFCFTASSTLGTLGPIALTLAPGGEQFAGLIGAMINTCGNTGEAASLTGAAYVNAGGTARITLNVGGTAACPPLVLSINLPAPFDGTGSTVTIDQPTTGAFESTVLTAAQCLPLP